MTEIVDWDLKAQAKLRKEILAWYIPVMDRSTGFYKN